ncbi:MAG: flagellar basal body rod protein FlgC [Synergistetes bacterium]|nr:flagellar basal body rod protein FlgC [Synergistota bacterium]
MRIFKTIDISASALTAHRLWLDVIADNLANVNTTRTPEGGPYRRKMMIFESREKLFPEEVGFSFPPFPRSVPEFEGEGVRVKEIVEDPTPPRLVYDPNHPDADKQGYVAYPNVNVVREMVDMISASRAYEANLMTINTTRSMFMNALEIIRG